MQFLSTLSLRRATRVKSGQQHSRCNFYPRSPCGERQTKYVKYLFLTNFYPRSPCGERLDVNNPVLAVTSISIHALLAESDQAQTLEIASLCDFYPRSPCGERHAPNRRPYHCNRNFYPRSPCGERPRGEHHANSQQEFLSTLSLRRATTNRRPILF